MSAERRASRIIVVIIVWSLIVVVLGAAYRYVIRPYVYGRQPGMSTARYDDVVNVALDSFSGYSILRSSAVQEPLKAKRIKLEFHDDKADYEGRMKALKSGKIQMAVFTIDSFILNGAKLGEFPASIVLILDETKGADAIVAYKDAVKNIQALDNPEARFVLTPNSPSEFLARTVVAHFSLPSLPTDWWIGADGAGKVYKELQAARKNEKYAYVLWEPYVSKALEDPSVHVLIDSSKLKGCIVDVLVAERRFLSEKPLIASQVIESYLRAAYSYAGDPEKLKGLVMEDAKEHGESALSTEDATKVAGGILWKNTLENYAHFGLMSQESMGGVLHIEDMISNITDILVKTGGIREDPLGGKANTIYYDRILRDLKARDFRPGVKMDLIQEAGSGANDLGSLSPAPALPALNEAQWNALVPVGELSIPPIAFGRGTAQITIQGQRDLDNAAKKLQSFPQYYLVVTGNVRAEGDVEANRQLARERAAAVTEELGRLGLAVNRVRAVASEPSKQDGSAQSVTFVVGQAPY